MEGLRKPECRSDMNKKARILVVDDDASVRKALFFALSREGYFVDVAESSQQAILKSNKDFFHLALIDFRLSDIVGTKLMSLLRATVPRMRMVLMTGYPVVDNAIDAINRGADSYLTKPVDMQQLLRVIDQLLAKQAAEKELFEQQMMRYLKSKFEDEKELREKALQQQKENRLRLRIADCELPRHCLLYVFVSIGAAPISFGGVAYGNEGEFIRERLNLLAEERVVLYEAVDQNGLESSGLCKVEGLNFDETPTVPIRLKFSGQLAHPFI